MTTPTLKINYFLQWKQQDQAFIHTFSFSAPLEEFPLRLNEDVFM